jgi:hypothetical protein
MIISTFPSYVTTFDLISCLAFYICTFVAFYLFYVLFKFFAKDSQIFQVFCETFLKTNINVIWAGVVGNMAICCFFLSFVNDNLNIFSIFFSLSAKKYKIHMIRLKSQTDLIIKKKKAKFLGSFLLVSIMKL